MVLMVDVRQAIATGKNPNSAGIREWSRAGHHTVIGAPMCLEARERQGFPRRGRTRQGGAEGGRWGG